MPRGRGDGKQATAARGTPAGSPLQPSYKNLKHTVSIAAAGERRAALLRPGAPPPEAARPAATPGRKDTRPSLS